MFCEAGTQLDLCAWHRAAIPLVLSSGCILAKFYYEMMNPSKQSLFHQELKGQGPYLPKEEQTDRPDFSLSTICRYERLGKSLSRVIFRRTLDHQIM